MFHHAARTRVRARCEYGETGRLCGRVSQRGHTGLGRAMSEQHVAAALVHMRREVFKIVGDLVSHG